MYFTKSIDTVDIHHELFALIGGLSVSIFRL